MDGEEFPEAPNGSSTHTLSASLKRNFDRLTANGDHAEATGSNLHNPDANASDRNGNKRLRSSSPTRAQGHGQTSLMAPSSLANVYNTSQPSTMSSSRVLDDDGSSNSTTHTSMLLDAPVSLATSFLRPRTGSETTPISTASGPAAVNGSDRSTPLQDRSSLTRDEWQITNRDTTGQNRTLTSISGPSILQSLPNASSLSGTRQGATQAQLDALETVLARSRDFQANVQAILESPVSAQGVRPPIPTRGATGDPSGTTLPRRHTTTPRWPELVPIALDSPRSVLMSSVAYESVDSSGNETDATARVQTAETSASEQPLVPNWGSRSTGPSIAAVEHPAANILHNGSAPVLPFRSHPPRRIGSPPTMDWSQVPASAETLTSAASTIDSNEASESMSRMATPPTSPRMVMPVEERRTYQNPRSAGTTNSNWRRLVPVPNSPALRSDPASVDVNAGNASDGSFSFRPQPLPGSGPTALSRGGLAHGPPIMSSGVRSGTRRSSLLRNVIETSPVPDQFRNHIRLEDGDSFHNPFPPALGPVASRSQNIPSPNRTNNDPRQLSHSSSLPQPRLPQWQRRLAPYPPQLSQRRDWLHEGPVHDRTRNWADSLWSPGGEDWDDPTGNSFPDDIADDMTTFRGVRNPGERYPQANRIPSVGDTDAVDVGLLNDLSGDSQHNSSSRPSPSWEQPVEWNPSPSLIPPRIRSDGLSTVYRRSQAISGDRRTRNTSDEVVASSFESSGVATPVFRDLVDMPGGSGPEPANAQRSHRQPPGLLRRLTHNAGLFPPFTRRADEPPEVYVIAPSASREETVSFITSLVSTI
ncbi:uncharacterized protein EI90DRAFT_1601552 [Cantharellus anzutake]|uniref:uncharacterized protein n=1 Tax=Cantharellus anzutake TaxID=1750568 RepID=UPI0019031902|nr:uncharacterized protein EI90DRAFT_1601552 [Cantharellus anzutake]KAF8328117.1 hypothetical protein EI90DRAFT_1601552 [Cantharellus anzutake]